MTAWTRNGDGLVLTGNDVELVLAPTPPVPVADLRGTSRDGDGLAYRAE